MRYSTLVAGVSTLAAASFANGQINKQCPSDDLCYSLNIPDATAQSGTGDIYFQIQASTKYQWIGLGQGTQMKGANMFILYTDNTGRNVTLSPRLGVGEVEPEHGSDNAQVTLLEGTGVSDTMMTANVKCTSCSSWSGGTMNFADKGTNWIYAYKTGSPIDNSDLNAEIEQHDSYGYLSYEKAAAQGGDSANPFVVAAAAAGGSSSAEATNTAAGTASQPTDDSNYSSGQSFTGASSRSGVPFGGDLDKAKAVQMAHGILGSLAFVIFFPIGAILVRVLKNVNPTWIHAGVQATGLLLFIAAFGLGCYLASELDLWNNHHPIIGVVLFVFVLIQPILGLLHHWMFKKTFERRTWSFMHIWIGRVLIILGMINGGLGLDLAGNASKGQLAAYGIVAGVIGVAYLAAIVFGEMDRKKNPPVRGAAPGSRLGAGGSPTRQVRDYGSEEKITS